MPTLNATLGLKRVAHQGSAPFISRQFSPQRPHFLLAPLRLIAPPAGFLRARLQAKQTKTSRIIRSMRSTPNLGQC